MTRQVGNEIDEFVTEALRNNLLGLPLDLARDQHRARPRHRRSVPERGAARVLSTMTGDSQLKPYTSWVDFVQHLKHPESLVNFIAAYGTHATITRRDHARGQARARPTALVFGGDGAPADRLDFLNSTGAWASGPNGITTTGLDNVDLWIGGLAEEKMPFGGMLGSTFNFVFEDAAREAAGRRPLLLPGAHRRPQLPHRAGEQLVRQADHGEHRRHASAGRRLLDAGLHPRGRPDAAVHGPGPSDGQRRPGRRRIRLDARWLDPEQPGDAGRRYQLPRSTPATSTSCSAAPTGNDILIASEGDDTL